MKQVSGIVQQIVRWLHRNGLTLVLALISATCLTLGISMFVPRYTATHNPIVPNAHQTVRADTDHPSETKPTQTQLAAYTVPADQPRSIAIPSVHINGLIQRVGLTPGNAVATPGSIYFAGWFVDSAKPGDNGLSIVDGHVSGWYNDGIFKHLIAVKPGASIVIEYGDKSLRTFVVVSVRSVPEKQAAALLFERQASIRAQLNLITCGGNFNYKTNLYENRVIVTAERMS